MPTPTLARPSVSPAAAIIPVEKVYALEVPNPHGHVRHFLLCMSTNGGYMTTMALEAAFPFLESTVQAYRDQLLFMCGVNALPVEICA